MNLLTEPWGEQFRTSIADPAWRRLLAEQARAMGPLAVAYDNDGLWDWGAPDDDGPALLRQMVDQYVHAGATFLVWGAGGHTAWNFRPRRMQPLWETPGWELIALAPSLSLSAGIVASTTHDRRR